MFKTTHITGRTINDTWFNLLYSINELGRKNKIDSGSFEKETYRLEFDFVSGTITHPIQYTDSGVRVPLAVNVPEGCPAPTNEADIEDYFVNYIMDSNLATNEHYRYSTWLVGGNYKLPKANIDDLSIDKNILITVPNQVQWCIDHFKQKGYGTNHCCISVGYPESNLAYDVKYDSEMDRGTSPCLRIVDLKIVEDDGVNHLLLNCYFRSWDLYSGLPVNLGGLALLMEYICNELGDVSPGSLSFCSKGLHIYGFQMEALKARLNLK
jgi:thymidylate synthase